MIDLHCHLLPGLDDGPGSVEESVRMARAALEDGVDCLVATPHIDHVHHVEPQHILESTLALRRALREVDLPLRVLTGGEVTIARAAELSDAELRAVALGTSSWVLLECPLVRGAGSLEETVFSLQLRGFRALLAHPERSPQLMGDVDRVEELVRRGALCSVSGGALLGRFGSMARVFARKLLDQGLVHNVGSDAHDGEKRPPTLARALEAAVTGASRHPVTARWLGHDVPEALLADGPLPPRPVPGRWRGGARRWHSLAERP